VEEQWENCALLNSAQNGHEKEELRIKIKKELLIIFVR
jgi:hypothetical protein